jgi:hypothetical protein
MPPTHVLPAPHVFPHAPQFAGSTLVSTQLCPHCVVPPAQLSAHAPCEHTCPPVHALPQAPQLSGSVATVVQPRPHAVCPPLHVTPASLLLELVPHPSARDAAATPTNANTTQPSPADLARDTIMIATIP